MKPLSEKTPGLTVSFCRCKVNRRLLPPGLQGSASQTGKLYFYASAAQAEQAGFRPCLLCRPELAPGTAPVDALANLAYKAARK